MSKTPLFRLVAWTVSRHGKPIVGPLDLALYEGEVTTLMSPSGGGKTTCILTLLGYQAGGIEVIGQRFQGEDILANGEVPKGGCVFIPQHLPMNPNWEIGSYLCRLPWGERRWWHDWWPTTPSRRRRVGEILSQLGIGGKAHSTVAELSGGEIQRAALSQLLLFEPRLKLFVGDEYVTALDPGNMTWILDQSRSVVARSGGTALLALHDAHAALHISDQIALLWPRQWASQIWRILPNTPFWNSDALYSLLCLARWIQDMPSQNTICDLLSLLKDYPESLKTLGPPSPDVANIWITEGASGFRRLDDPAIKQACAQGFHLGKDAAFQPVRMNVNGSEMLGVTIREPHMSRLVTLLAKAQGAETKTFAAP